jgi:hypothetical protein
MADRLLDQNGDAVPPNEVIKDQLGRDWSFWLCSFNGVTGLDDQIYVRRMTNGKPAKRPTSFRAEFFPDYQIEHSEPSYLRASPTAGESGE